MGRLLNKPLGAFGSQGQNTQTTDIDLPPEFATAALDCYLNQSGRLTARRSLEQTTAANSDLGAANNVERVYRHNKADGTSILVCSGNGRIFRSDGDTLVSIGSGYSANRWQFATLNGKLFAAQVSHSLRYFNETTYAETTVATPSNPRAIHSAYGRLWALSSDGWTLHWSDLLDGTNFTTGASGSYDLSKLHTQVRSPALAVIGVARQIVVLCRDQILVFGLADDLDPNNADVPIYLRDSVPSIGTLARDSVANIGDDVLFLADDGLRSLSRSMQERQGPLAMSDMSALNTRALMRSARTDTGADITAAWHPENGWYQLFLPSTGEVWTFDVVSRVQGTDKPRVTVWRTGTSRPARHAVMWADDTMYYAGKGGLYTNDAYDNTDSYTMRVTTGWLSLGAPDAIKNLKKLKLNFKGGNGQTITVRWFVDFDETRSRSASITLETTNAGAEYGIAEYGVDEYASGLVSFDEQTQLSNSAKFVKFQIDIPIVGSEITLNNAQIFYTMGRMA